MEEIVIPNLEDDDDDLQLPSFGRSAFGGSSSSLPGLSDDPYTHRSQASSDSFARFGEASVTPSRPPLNKAATSQPVGIPTYDERRLGKFSNGSSTSIGGASIGSGSAAASSFAVPRKGSLASFKNAFKGSRDPSHAPPPPVPQLDGYPALKNPFSPASPTTHFGSPRRLHGERKQSFAHAHASRQSQGGRSIASNGSSRPDEFPPALPPIPMRATPSRLGRGGDSTSYRRQGSIGGEEGSTPGDEALRMVFRDFKAAADAKIARICARPLNTQPSLVAYLEAGTDSALDTLIVSLAHCSRRHPRRVSDLLHSWARSHSEGVSSTEARSQMDRSLGLQMRTEDAAAVLGARKSMAAKYLLNRALIELVRLTPKDVLGEELGMTLEGNAFAAYRVERDESAHQRQVSALQVELLGELSKTSDRFIREISKYATVANRENEIRMEHLLHGMQHLKLRVYPEEELEMSAEFVQALAALYSSASPTLKSAYGDTFVALLHTVVETATAEVNHPIWAKAISVILQRALAMSKNKATWAQSFPLVVVSLAVSPRDVFMQHWQPTVEAVLSRMKDRTVRNLALNGLVRLFWVYLNRCAESSTSTRKRVDALFRYFFSDNGPLFPADMPLEPFTTAMHYAFTRQLDIAEDMLAETRVDPDPAHTNRATCLIRAIGCSLRAVEEERLAQWPPDATKLPDSPSSGDALSETMLANPEVVSLVQKSGPVVFKIMISCDRLVGGALLSSDSVAVSGSASSSSIDNPETVTRKHGDVHASVPTRYGPTLRLLATLLDHVPRLLGDVNFGQVANLLSRATFSADPRVCEAAAGAMRRMSAEPSRCLFLVNTYREFVFETRHVFRDTFVASRLLESQFERVVQLWYDICEQLVQHQRIATALPDEDGPTLGSSGIAKIEACAVFLLASSSVALRRLGGKIVAIARDLEGTLRRPSAAFRYSRIIPDDTALTRVSQLYEIEEGALRNLPWLSATDRTRLDAAVAEGGKVLQRLAESDQAKDASLWVTLLPYFVLKMSDHLTIACAELRAIVCGAILRLQGHIHTVGTSGGRRGGHRSASDLAGLAEQWRSYLSILCVTMPAQGVAPTPISRTNNVIVLTAETIHTPVVFQYLASLFSWDDPRFKDAAVHAMGVTRQASLRPLAEVLLGTVRRLADRKTPGGALWTAVAQVFKQIAPSTLDTKSSSHIANLSSMISFVKITYNLLAEPSLREDYELQSLRRSFCVVVEHLTHALGKLDDSDRFFGEELRGPIFKLCYDWCFVGRRADVAKARESRVVQVAADTYSGERDKAAYLDDLQAKTRLLSAAAAEAMAGLCQGRLVSVDSSSSEHTVDPLIVLRWIRGMLTSSAASHHDTARKALYSLLKYNRGDKLLDEVLHQSFGEGEQFAMDASFFGVIADILSDGQVQLPIERLCCLTLSKLGHPVNDIRQRAFQLAVLLLRDSEARVELAQLLPAVSSGVSTIYRQAQQDVAAQVAAVYSDSALAFVSECSDRLSQLEAPRRAATLAVLPAWLEHVDIAVDGVDLSDDESALELKALSNIVYLAVRFFDDHAEDIVRMFDAFAGDRTSSNMTALIKHLFEQSAKRRKPDFVSQAQKIVACLARCDGSEFVFDEICGFIEPAALAAVSEEEASPSASQANLDSVMSASRSHSFSTGQLAFILAVEMLPYRLRDVELGKRLPKLLHVALAQVDSTSAFIRDQARAGLFQVLRAWISDMSGVAGDQAAAWASAEHKLTALARSGSAFWRAEDQADREAAFLAPSSMTTMILKVLGILTPLHPKIKQSWGEIALTWATSCPIRHVACRSFQIFRVLSPRGSAKMISDILARLSSTIGSASSEIQAFNREVLRTLCSIVQNMTAVEVSSFPQIFWCAVACLNSPFEDEFAEVIDLLSHILDKTNLSDPAVVERLASAQPPDWVGPTPHVQTMLLVGLRSSKTDMLTFDLIRRISCAPLNDLIDPPATRLLNGFIAAMPWMLHSTDLGEPNEELANMAADLAVIAEAQGNPSFSRLLTSFARVKFRSKDDFIRQACSLLRDYLAEHALQVVALLLAFTLNDTDWMREKSMQVLQLILQSADVRAPLVNNGVELLQPLLRLVSTKHAAQALELLDMPIVAAAQAEALTTSMMATGDIFGSISPSGWSVPKAQEMASFAKENVTAVFNTCTVEARAASAHFSVVQFADVKAFNASMLSLNNMVNSPPVPVMSPDNASMGDLVSALHSLGQFFGESEDVPRVRHATQVSDSISERRVKAILARGRHPSVSSPIYENSPVRRHRHMPSDAFTESSQASSADDTTQRLNGARHGFGHGGNLSMSSMSEVGDRTDHLFALEEHPDT